MQSNYPAITELFAFTLALTIIWPQWTPFVQSIECPATLCTCRWKGGKETTECAGHRLSTLPQGLSLGTQVLDLSRNSFQELPKEMFLKASLTNLQKVYLAECKIRKIDDDAFSDLANLVELDLERNLLIAVPSETFVDCPELRRLNLNRNHIRRVESNAFVKLPSLTSLELSNCFLEYVGPRAFVGLNHLQHLKLDGNRLTTLPVDVGFPLPSLHSLDLFDNPWLCDCRLRVLRNWLSDDRLPVNEPPVCAEPSRLQDRTLIDVEPNDYACIPIPQHQRPPTALEAFIGDRVTVIECHVHGDPPPLIRWTHDDQSITSADQRKWSISERTTKTHTTSSLSIGDVSLTDAGQYLCVAENQAGQVTVNITLDIVERPLEISAMNDGHIVLISLALVIVTLTTVIFLFIFLLRMRHQIRLDDEMSQCKHLPLMEKKQLVNHVKFSVHNKNKMEITTTTTVLNSNNYSNNGSGDNLMDKIRLDQDFSAISMNSNNSCRPDVVNCNYIDHCSSKKSKKSPVTTPIQFVGFKSENNESSATQMDRRYELTSGDKQRVTRSAGGYSPLYEDSNSESPIRLKKEEQELPDNLDDEDELIERLQKDDVTMRTFSRRPLINNSNSNSGNAVDNRDPMPSRTPFNRTLIAGGRRSNGNCSASSTSGSVTSATLGNASGILKHSNLHGRNYVPVLPPLPAHHFAQARDSPDEGYEDEVELVPEEEQPQPSSQQQQLQET